VLMRTFGYIAALLLATTGCGSIEWAPGLRPPVHPLLNTSGWRHAHLPITNAVSKPTEKKVEYALIRRNQLRLDPMLYRTRMDEMAFLRAVFRNTRWDKGLRTIHSPNVLAGRRTLPIKGPPKIGDLLFFDAGPVSPTVAVVSGRPLSGTVPALAIHLGRVRTIYINRTSRFHRRRSGRIVNTFVRRIRPSDPPGLRYLAGDALRTTRRLHSRD
jgi:hypothetical protein